MSATVADTLRAVHGAMCQAMVDADADALGQLLADDFTLTHMTGYRQLRAEWLQQVRDGRMSYHRMADAAVHVDASDTAHPVLTARTWTEATIWGSSGAWRLSLTSAFVKHGPDWLIAETVASTW